MNLGNYDSFERAFFFVYCNTKTIINKKRAAEKEASRQKSNSKPAILEKGVILNFRVAALWSYQMSISSGTRRHWHDSLSVISPVQIKQ